MLSKTLRVLTYSLAILYAILGIVLFLAPAWSAANFSWGISPFVAMTMGGWCLGNAYTAWDAARLWRWSLVYNNLLYLWTFGVLETAVLFLFRDRLILDVPLAWPYLLTLALTVIAAALGLAEWMSRRPAVEAEGQPVPRWVRALAVLFVLFVGFLALYGAFSGQNGYGTNGRIFPEPLTLFTLRAFAAFYASLAIAVVPTIWARGSEPLIVLGRAGMSFIVPITIAALINLDKFDFAARPGGLIYLGAYVVAFFVVGGILLLARWQTPAARLA